MRFSVGCGGQVKRKSGQGSEIEYFFQENSTKCEDLARGWHLKLEDQDPFFSAIHLNR